MYSLVADSTGFWSWTAPDDSDVTLVATDPQGTVVDVGTLTYDGRLWSLDIQSSDLPRSKVGRWVFDPRRTVTVDGKPQTISDPQVVWLLPNRYPGYGDLAEVLGYLGQLLPKLSESSRPSLTEVLALMARQSEEYDLRLSTAGYQTPLSSDTGRNQLGHAVSLYVTGQVKRRLTTGHGDWSGVSAAKGYESDAEEIVMRVIRGQVVLPERQ